MRKYWPVNHRRSADLARTGDLLCPIFHSPGEPEGFHRWNHRSSGGVLDASDGLQRETLAVAGVKCLRLPPRSPNLNAFAERGVRSVKEECLSHLILFGERSLRKALSQFQEHYHAERNHQGKNNVLLFPAPAPLEPGRRRGIRCRERLGGLLR